MNFIRKSYLAVLSVLAAAGIFTGCQEEENVAKAVMASANALSFPGEEASEQLITVYSDAEWTADVPEWVTIEPATGSGTTDVTVSVNANMRDGALDNPRRAELVFHGKTLMSRASVIVSQTGDKFRDVKDFSVSDVAAADDETVVIVPSAQVSALTSKGFVVTDGTSSVYVLSSEEVALGDAVSIWGTKDSDKSLPAITLSDTDDKVIVNSNSAVTYPEPEDITASVDTYTSSSRTFVKISGLLKGNNLNVEKPSENEAETKQISVAVLDAHSSLAIAKLNNHNVVLYGYFAGIASNTLNIIAVKFDDNGAAAGTGSLPVEWKLGTDDINFKTTFPQDGIVNAVKNEGTIKYVPYDLANTDANSKYKLDVSANNPRVTGPWPGDYWDFMTNASAKAGDVVEISFETRTSGTGHKFWRLEYLDGSEWKVAGTPLTTSEPGEEITYTHAMNSDGSTNVFVDTQVTYSSETPVIEFRFVCAANWQANGKGKLAARNGGSARLSITESGDSSRQPMVRKGAAGGKTVVFEDDFSWTEPLVAACKAAGVSVGDTVNDKDKSANAPNVYTASADLKDAFFKIFTDQMGYEDMNPAAELVYLQPGYLKFSRTGGNNTSVRLPKLDLDSASDIDVEFDFAAMVQGSGTVDDTKLVVRVEGDGEFENGTKYSNVFAHNQAKDEFSWTHAKTTVKGATSSTRLVIVMYRVLTKNDAGAYTGEYNYSVGGAGRFFLDNIKITK